MPRYCRGIILVILLFPVFASFRSARAQGDIHGSAHLTYRSTETKRGEEPKERTWGFTQVYDLGVTKALTPKIDFSANLDVNVTETDNQKTTRLMPDLRLNVRNEYFDANTGYRITEQGLDILTMHSDEDRFTTEQWNANLITKSEKYPRLRLRYNEDKNYDYLTVHDRDTKTTNFSGMADYKYRFLDFNYEYRNDNSEDFVTEATQETDTHDGRINFRKSFWENKITSSGSYLINNRKTETRTRGEEVREEEKETVHHGLYAHDDDTKLEEYDDLIDGTASINIGGGNTDQNIGVDMNRATEVALIYLYTDTPGSTFRENDFVWAVYQSSDNNDWQSITSAASFDYDTTENRFEISFTETRARYFKVVNTSSPAGYDLNVQKIEAYSVTMRASFTTTETEATTETTQASLGFRPAEWLFFTYDFTLDEYKTEEEDESDKTTRRSHNMSGRVDKELHKYLTTWAQYRRRLEYDSEAEEEDRTTDTYLLHFLSSPLETLDTDLSLSHTVLKEGTKTRSKTTSALLQIGARLREGADLDVDGNIIRSENLESDTETTTKSIDSNLRLELTRMLTAEIEYNIDWAETEGESDSGSDWTSNSEITFYWRPSHDFYFRGSYGINDNKSGDKTSRQQYNMNWLMTEKMQLSMGYNIDRNDTVSRSYSSDLSWNLSRMLTLRCGYNLSREEADTDTETQTFTADLSARF